MKTRYIHENGEQHRVANAKGVFNKRVWGFANDSPAIGKSRKGRQI
jgi:hypothetical protein